MGAVRRQRDWQLNNRRRAGLNLVVESENEHDALTIQPELAIGPLPVLPKALVSSSYRFDSVSALLPWNYHSLIIQLLARRS